MSDESSAVVLPFARYRRSTSVPPSGQAGLLRKFGLWPLGGPSEVSDVLVSADLFHLIVSMLEQGTSSDQKDMARQLRENLRSPFL